jgi:hypothetical protein
VTKVLGTGTKSLVCTVPFRGRSTKKLRTVLREAMLFLIPGLELGGETVRHVGSEIQ